MFIETARSAEAPSGHDARTRDRVLRRISEEGPVTAAGLAATLGLTPTAVRRHLDALVERGDLATTEVLARRRSRGRPARAYVVTTAGHGRLSSEYDDVATAALRYLADRFGHDAVHEFARQRVSQLEERYLDAVEAAGPDPWERAHALASALGRDGFAATTRPVGASERPTGLQLCQGHCPMHQVAEQFPQFCEAETEVFARLLGVRVQRLATLAHGEHVCTTFIPVSGTVSATHPGAVTRPPTTEGNLP